MNFEVNPAAYRSIVAIPSSIIEDNIKLAGALQLKVILYYLCHSGKGELTSDDIAEALFFSKEDVDDALLFWYERGILIKKGDEPAQVKSVSSATEAQPQIQEIPVAVPEKKVSEIPLSRPSHEQVAARISECKEFTALFAEAQNALGKTIGYDGQSILVMMHDSYGLPFEVILMAVEYAVSQKKTGFSYISKIGKLWSELEIDTLEGAMEYIEEHNVVDEIWKDFRSLTGLTNRNPTQKQRGFFVAWTKTYGFSAEMIYYAYEESIDHTGKMSLPYMDKILRSWYENGVKTPADIQKEKAKWSEAQENKRGTQSKKTGAGYDEGDASYDIDAFTKKAVGIKYKKKGTA